jgi:Rrf2 family cysteine metabolism transcriptional repressor
MKLTSGARYGLKICLVLAVSPDKYISAAEISDITGYSVKYTEKLMRLLKNADIVKAERGVTGGYKLNGNPENITLGQVIRPLEDNLEFVKCVSTICANEASCPTHGVWKKLYNGINDLLDSMTLKEIIDDCGSNKGGHHEKKNLSGPCGDYKC